MSLWVPVVAAAVGGFVGVIGGIAGAWLRGIADVAQWRRERRLDAYSDFMYRSGELIFAVFDYEVSFATKASEDKRLVAVAAIGPLDRAEGRVMLVATKAIRERAEAITDFVSANIGNILSPDETHAADTHFMNDLAKLNLAFAEVARREFEPSESTVSWWPRKGR